MVDTPYSGTAVRQGHFASKPSVAGINPQHFHPAPTVDLFNPAIDTPAGQAGDVWGMTDNDFLGSSGYPNLAQVPVEHWFAGAPAVPSGVPYGQAQQAMQDRMMLDHAQSNYVPDSVRHYVHATQGQVRAYEVGRMPNGADIDLSGSEAGYLANGKNGYAQTNQPNEVYAGDEANVGRYRLGYNYRAYGTYDNPLGKFGQDALLRAYTGLYPAFPQDKAPGTAPYNPSSHGTTLTPPAVPFQAPSNFALPEESQMTDFAVMAQVAGAADFYDSASEFY